MGSRNRGASSSTMGLLLALLVAVVIAIVFVRNGLQMKETVHEEWIDCMDIMVYFHTAPCVDDYRRILRLQMSGRLSYQHDRLCRLWIRRVLEMDNRYHSGTPEENIILLSVTLISNLNTIVDVFNRGGSSVDDVTAAIDETVVQYGATGDAVYLQQLVASADRLHAHAMLRERCLTQVHRLQMIKHLQVSRSTSRPMTSS